ncbi:MAG: GNAT family N-acetyltransferase [Caldilineaceae bacterium]|nr:GNAT family N-acetyltransferase [Caldilineaceae bacterium]
MSTWALETTTTPGDDDVEALHVGLRAHNLAQLGPDAFNHYEEVAVYARAEDGSILGGIYGELLWEWLYIRTFWVAEEQRQQGIGSQLLQAIEQAARERGVGHAHLETTSFQALAFYQRHGYAIFGEIQGKPAGHDWYFLQKSLI